MMAVKQATIKCANMNVFHQTSDSGVTQWQSLCINMKRGRDTVETVGELRL